MKTPRFKEEPFCETTSSRGDLLALAQLVKLQLKRQIVVLYVNRSSVFLMKFVNPFVTLCLIHCYYIFSKNHIISTLTYFRFATMMCYCNLFLCISLICWCIVTQVLAVFLLCVLHTQAQQDYSGLQSGETTSPPTCLHV